MKKHSNRIREIRKQRDLTLEQVADLASTSHQQIQRLESGERRLTVEWMERVASALRCNPAELLTSSQHNRSLEPPQGTLPPSPPPNNFEHNAIFAGPINNLPTMLTRDVPLMGTAECGSGSDYFEMGGDGGNVHRPLALIGNKKTYAIIAAGESMAPAIHPGDVIYADPTVKTLKNGDVVIVQILGEDDYVTKAVLKEYIKSTPTTVYLRSYNPDYDQDIQVPREQVRCIHRARWKIGDLCNDVPG
ncbi:MAG: helix-turn-helix domain-containing protein [Chloroflexi bacterium]|nr:helix-turn-helix domain-containing protein [Chloroflexota bacterium]